MNILKVTLFGLVLYGTPVQASDLQCNKIFELTDFNPALEVIEAPSNSPKISLLSTILSGLKDKAIDHTLNLIGYTKGLPAYLKRVNELQQTGQYLKYNNFGEMGLAEMNISVRYDKAKLAGLNTGKPLIIVANHPLGIADGLALQHLTSRARNGSQVLLLLARWIEKLLPNAIFGDEHNWGTAVPVDINKPEKSDPLYEKKLAEIKSFNSRWNRTSIKTLKNGGAVIIFPAGHVASINKDGESYPNSVYDAPGSWQDSVLSLARLGNADIVFANIDSVNSQSFYDNRKRFGGGDKERVIWFFSEALAKKGKAIDVYLSDPMSIEAIYNFFPHHFNYSRAELEIDSALVIELMRRYTYEVPLLFPQELDTKDSPQKIADPAN
jgi:putative hemolysin